jgi:hypothetical protein
METSASVQISRLAAHSVDLESDSHFVHLMSIAISMWFAFAEKVMK